MLKNIDWKELWIDLLVDIAAGMLIAIGINNFALSGEFSVAGFTGLSIVMYHLWGIPVGWGTVLLNIPTILICYRFLGKEFYLKSLKTVLISSFLTDYVAVLIPQYHGSPLIACICAGTLSGAGFAFVFMRDSSTGGQDFITMSIKRKNPHIAIGVISFFLDMVTILIDTVTVFHSWDNMAYGLIMTYIISKVIDKIMYGVDAGKVTLIVTEKGKAMCEAIDKYAGRGATILKGTGAYTGRDKDVVICACNNKEMYAIRRIMQKVDKKAFTITMNSTEVVGEGFKEEIKDL